MRNFLHKYVGHLFFLVIIVCSIIMCKSILLDSNNVKYRLLQVWADYLSNTTEIPQSGHYQCEELHLSISFGKNTSLLFPDGKVVALAIDYGGNVYELHQGDPIIRGNYTSRLSKGYIEMTFISLPIEFTEGRTYRFYLLEENASVLRCISDVCCNEDGVPCLLEHHYEENEEENVRIIPPGKETI